MQEDGIISPVRTTAGLGKKPAFQLGLLAVVRPTGRSRRNNSTARRAEFVTGASPLETPADASRRGSRGGSRVGIVGMAWPMVGTMKVVFSTVVPAVCEVIRARALPARLTESRSGSAGAPAEATRGPGAVNRG